jgi:hypothetical protein
MPEDEKLKKIREAEQQRTKKDLHAFLGLAGYYWKFISGFATMAIP